MFHLMYSHQARQKRLPATRSAQAWVLLVLLSNTIPLKEGLPETSSCLSIVILVCFSIELQRTFTSSWGFFLKIHMMMLLTWMLLVRTREINLWNLVVLFIKQFLCYTGPSYEARIPPPDYPKLQVWVRRAKLSRLCFQLREWVGIAHLQAR